jgi:hypothetical protein
MTDPNIKQVQITGAAAEGTEQSGGNRDSSRSNRSRKRKLQIGGEENGKTLKVSKEGGGGMSTGTAVQMSASHIPGAPSDMKGVVGANSSLTEKGAPVATGGSAAAAAQQTPVKVVLAAPKKKSKVVLAAAKAPAPKLNLATGGAAATKTRKAHSTARKIKFNMKSLSKKINRATTIRKKAAETGIDHVKKTLQKAGILKADSKAPEQILRQMYADFMTLKNRAL